ncbi:hypothetical protein GDO86_019663 [Hymenochirus boettgeri]|uniref:Olfactory receptor n=1 Tax=Hymenochirus boettgeri TaxID=247094 RepID=A0A8T2IMY0_9PIPI|nr:hypothetical protein GDO86_019663 [Hymenochirus boettgeri]
MANHTEAFMVILVGFPGLPQRFYGFVSVLMFFMYMASLLVNGAVILLVIWKENLHHPMYIVIANLAFSDLLFDTITLPKIMAKYWFGDETISFSLCLFQMFLVHYFGSLDGFIIMLMAIDRYVAICKPLRYSSIITNKVLARSCIFSWIVLATFVPLTSASLNSKTTFCGRNKIISFFCTNVGVTSLSCADITFYKQIIYGLGMVALLVPLSLILISYIIIIKTICTSTRSENWSKGFYTCTTHLLVIILYFVPRVFVYSANQVRLIIDPDVNVLILCLYTFVPHVASPVIYCLRTKEIKHTFVKILKKKRFRILDTCD